MRLMAWAAFNAAGFAGNNVLKLVVVAATVVLVSCGESRPGDARASPDVVDAAAAQPPAPPPAPQWWIQVRSGDCARSFHPPDDDVATLSSDGSQPIVKTYNDQNGNFLYEKVYLPATEEHEAFEQIYFQDERLCQTTTPVLDF